jgi:beta-galactosidase
VATRPGRTAMHALVTDACALAGVRPVLEGAPPGVEAVRRGDALVLLNHGTEPTDISLAGGAVTLAGRDVRVLTPYYRGV